MSRQVDAALSDVVVLTAGVGWVIAGVLGTGGLHPPAVAWAAGVCVVGVAGAPAAIAAAAGGAAVAAWLAWGVAARMRGAAGSDLALDGSRRPEWHPN